MYRDNNSTVHERRALDDMNSKRKRSRPLEISRPSHPLLLSIKFSEDKRHLFYTFQQIPSGDPSATVIGKLLSLGPRYLPLIGPLLVAYVGVKGRSFLQQLLPEGIITHIVPSSPQCLVLRVDGLSDFSLTMQNDLADELKEIFDIDINTVVALNESGISEEEYDFQEPVTDEEAQELEKWIAQSVKERSKESS